MSPVLTVALLGALLAAPDNGTPPPKAEFQIWVLEVHSEGRKEPYFDKGLEEVRDAVKDPHHDTYKNLKSLKHVFKDDKPLRTALTDRYTLDTSMPTLSDDGRYRLNLRVNMKAKEDEKKSGSPLLQPDGLLPPPKNTKKPKEIEALSSKLVLQPEEKVVVRGLKLEDGKEMVLVVSMRAPGGENGP